MKRKIVSVLLCVLLLASLLPVSAFADTTAGGTCGDNLTWTLDSNGTLTISGTGKMWDYSYDSNAPWYSSSSSVKCVIISDGVTNIGNYAFYYCYCRSLTSVTIPDSVTSIGGHAFRNCDGLTKVTIPDSVTSIGNYAFYDCDGLTSVTIGNSVTRIGDYAFRDCTRLTEINYNAKAVGDLARDVFYNAGTSGSGIKVTFGDSVEKIPAYLFYTSNSCRPNISYVSIGSNVTSIGDLAFYNCTGLTEINYNAKAVGDLARNSDVFLEAGTAESGIKVTFGEKVKKVPDYLFSTQSSFYSPKIREIVFLGNAPTIGSKSFNGVTTSAYYPYGNDTWTSEVMKGYGGQITWKPYSDAEAVSVVCNGKTSYIVGDELEENSISVTIERSDGCIEKYNYASGKITLGEYDMSKSGKQSITVTCKDVTAQLNIYIHDLTSETMPANDYPESSHNYEANLDKTYTYTADGAYSLDVTFSNETEVETNIDYIYVNGTTYTGKELANKTVHINGDTLTVRLVSDDSDGAYGFSIDSIIATYVVYEYTDTVVAPTCTAKGYTIHTCACGESRVDSYVDALGHDFGAWKQTKAPTCTEKGTETKTCTRCNATETRDVAALGHSYGNWTQTKAPTCTAKGTETKTCTRCNASETRDVNALGHSYANGKCTRCGAADPNYKPAPKAPELKITTSAGKPKIYWNAVDGAAKYWIYRSTDGKNFKYYDSTTKTSYTNNSTAIGSTYYYKVKAIGANGAKSDYSVSKGILCKPAAPTVSINRSNGKPKLSWKAVSGATKYWIYRSTDGVNFKYWDSTTKTRYTNSGAASGTKYYYRVKAVAYIDGVNVTSANSSTKSLMTSLAKPSVSITTSNGKPKLTWKAVTGADKYYIYRSTDGKNFSYFDSTTKTTYVNSGAKKNTKYYYKVKAVCASNSNANSAQSAAVSIKATK